MARFERSQQLTGQAANRDWWERNPMTYDWEESTHVSKQPDSWFDTVDERFFEESKHFAHPEWPEQVPFGRLVDFSRLGQKRILEIGCGMGSHAELFSRYARPLQLVVVDITTAATRTTHRRLASRGLKGSVVQTDAETLPFPSSSFDFVWSWGVIHHAHSTEKIVGEIRRILAPGGSCKIMVYNRHSARYWGHGGFYRGIARGELLRKSLQEINMDFTDGHFARHFTANELRSIFAANGFQSCRCSILPESTVVPIPGCGRLARSCSVLAWLNRAAMARWGWFLFLEATAGE